MSRLVLSMLVFLLLGAFVAFGSVETSHAQRPQKPDFASTPYDLVNAVNALRAAYGVPPYSVNSILMYTAQSQADFLASTSTMTHSGPGGIGLTERLLAAGYPLAGDLSLGGFRAENITGGKENMTAESAVEQWTGDALHLDTMISPNLTEIGAGVAVSNGRVYYVIDAALPTTTSAPSVSGGSSVPSTAGAAQSIPVPVNTPNADGNVFHEVKAGQTLWQIAIAYGVKTDEIKSLNNLFDNNIYPGNILLIKTGLATPMVLPTKTITPETIFTATGFAASTTDGHSVTATPARLEDSTARPANNVRKMKLVLGIIAVALVGGGLFAYLGKVKKD